MKSLFLLIALYTISSKQAVPSGDIPDGSSCVYEQSGNKSGQLTAGNYLKLELNGYDGIQLQSITLRMHSNVSAGAGSMQLTVGESVIWSIAGAPFSNNNWVGRYSTDWVDISQSFNGTTIPPQTPITLHIQATQNSLYLQSVAVEYMATQTQTETYTVSFNTYSPQRIASLTEVQTNAGVVLPDLPVNDASWQFYGWATRPVDNSEIMPAAYKAGGRYYPASDCTLHAVYVQQGEAQPWWPTDDLSLGDYMIAFYTSGTMWHATGDVTNGMLPTVTQSLPIEDGRVAMPVNQCTESSVYTLGVTNDTLTIRHKATNSAVLLGSNGKFAKTSSGNNAWIIQPMEVETDNMPRYSISGATGGKTYYVTFYVDGSATIYFRPTSDAAQQHDLLLYALSDMEPAVSLYSSYAFGTALTDIPADNILTYSLPIGPYVLTIKNGKKYLQINE